MRMVDGKSIILTQRTAQDRHCLPARKAPTSRRSKCDNAIFKIIPQHAALQVFKNSHAYLTSILQILDQVRIISDDIAEPERSLVSVCYGIGQSTENATMQHGLFIVVPDIMMCFKNSISYSDNPKPSMPVLPFFHTPRQNIRNPDEDSKRILLQEGTKVKCLVAV